MREKNERVGRNPKTGERIKINTRRVLTERASQILKAMLKGADTAALRSNSIRRRRCKWLPFGIEIG